MGTFKITESKLRKLIRNYLKEVTTSGAAVKTARRRGVKAGEADQSRATQQAWQDFQSHKATEPESTITSTDKGSWVHPFSKQVTATKSVAMPNFGWMLTSNRGVKTYGYGSSTDYKRADAGRGGTKSIAVAPTHPTTTTLNPSWTTWDTKLDSKEAEFQASYARDKEQVGKKVADIPKTTARSGGGYQGSKGRKGGGRGGFKGGSGGVARTSGWGGSKSKGSKGGWGSGKAAGKGKGKGRDKKKKNESINESKTIRTTVKEVKRWMKTLEENRYRKIVNADARRVSWLVNNNLAEDYESMPKSIRKKWPKAAYGRERYLAREYINSKSTEKKLRESIRKIIKKTMSEEDSSTRLNRDRRSAAKTDLIKAKAERERAKAAKDRAKAKQKSLHNN